MHIIMQFTINGYVLTLKIRVRHYNGARFGPVWESHNHC